jgi:acetylornithine deacetylase/succinyl-diaminopimelate desuccinylase-like protein
VTQLDEALRGAEADFPNALNRLLALLRISSVSSTEFGRDGIHACARWLADALGELGFAVEIVPTAWHPVVLATRRGTGPKTVLFYGHYDVQPAEPLEAWTSLPFEPALREEDGLTRIYARGASDSKGQFWSGIEAIRALLAVGEDLPCTITLLLEGEEEAGSPSLAAFLDAYRERVACDVALVSDSSMWSPTRPAITSRLKGLIHEKITITAPNGELHSGHFGNVAANPVRLLAKVLSAIHDDAGRVLIPGFYDGVTDIPDALRQQWNDLNLKAALAGVSVAGGPDEGGFGPVELMWGRPGVDFNGISGGNTGPSERSVLPALAYARITARLVDLQEPEDIRRKLRDFVRARVPRGCTVSFDGEGGSTAVTINSESDYVAAAARALDAEWPEKTLIMGTGGAVPLVGLLKEKLGVDCIVTGFILNDDAIHAPNERFDTERYRKAIRSWIRVITKVSEVAPRS